MVRVNNSRGKQIVAPEIMVHYNKFMGGVDLGDQLISQYLPRFRCVKLWKKMVINILVTSSGTLNELIHLHTHLSI